MGKGEFLKAIAIVGILSTAVTIVIINSNKPNDADRIAIKSVQIESVENKLFTEHMERIRIAEDEARIAEEKRLEEIAKEKEEARQKAIARKAEIARQERLKEKKIIETRELASRGGSVETKIFELTFYTSLPEENGGYAQMANGESVHTTPNAIASNVYKLGTKIYLEGYGTYTVKDRGGSSFNNSNRLDVLILRKSGESDSAYKTRVRNMGRVRVNGYVVK